MRVLFLLNSLGAGGTERSTAVLLPYLRDRGVDAVVVCFAHHDEGSEELVVADGFDVRILARTSFAGRVREVRSLLRELTPDVLHTAIFDADQIGRLAAFRTGVPVVSSLINTPYTKERMADPRVSRWKIEATRLIDATTGNLLTTRFHAVTEGVAEDAASTLHIPRRKVTVVERGRDPIALGRRSDERSAATRASVGLRKADRVVLAVGRHEFQKAHVDLIEAMAIVGRHHPDVVTLIAGRTGNATADIEAAIARTGSGDRVRLLGNRDDVADLLGATDVFVMSSLYEGTAGAALEALALEAPIVGTDLQGTKGVLVHERNALLVPVGDVGAMAASVERLLEDRPLAANLAKAGREDFEARFSLDRAADRMVALYREVAGAQALRRVHG